MRTPAREMNDSATLVPRPPQPIMPSCRVELARVPKAISGVTSMRPVVAVAADLTNSRRVTAAECGNRDRVTAAAAGTETVSALVERIYAGVDPRLHAAARYSVLAH